MARQIPPPEARSRRGQSDDDIPALRWLRRIKRLFSLSVAGMLLLAAGLFVAALYLRSQELPATKVMQTSQMFDARGDLIDSFYSGQNRQLVALKDISPYVVKATLAIEDQHFYDHIGIDFKAVARAALVNLEHMSKVQGAGTITQQLARNLYLSHERTWARKLKETMYAVQMEMQLSKDDILDQYLNQIYYGHSTYGIQAAAQLFFGKDAKDLTLAESALLAGVPKGPRYYSPYYNMDNALERQKLVLQTMVNCGFITQAEADQAAADKLTFRPLTGKKQAVAPYFRDYVRSVAVEKLGIPEELLDEGGIRIYTTLDLKAQKLAEEAVQKQLSKSEELQAALVAIDPRTGYIKAMVGGRNYDDNQFNRATTGKRQPGSSFKPIMYLAALQKGLTPATRYQDVPTVFTYNDGKDTYAPNNFGDKYSGEWLDMRRAIAESNNIYAVHTILDIGPQTVVDMAKKMGFTSPLNPVPSLALGASPVTPLEMASAFAIIANQGVRAEPTAIVRIEDAAGKVLYQASPSAAKIIEPSYAYVLTNMMESVFEEGGTGSRVSSLMKRPVAGKTGTTDTDAWMVGYTPELATAVWVGYDKGKTVDAIESHMAAPIFAEFTEGVLDAVPPKLFTIPDGVATVYIDPESGKLANADCMKNARLEAFVKGTEPTVACTNRSGDSKANDKLKRGENSSWWNDLKRWWNS
ncbi:transglycosylase domain-containing protein [Gordoniibacillus kamchatkensis]|uniref:transglycosylase domain-containing protein n=1 Tax=Gordoniibacillus kamchatkensis TaxID=1590651 RepID=UPI0009E4DD63|nr:PBP1A family penicillin-binding protein [Paenibacillus sp. VKM B-2647]